LVCACESSDQSGRAGRDRQRYRHHHIEHLPADADGGNGGRPKATDHDHIHDPDKREEQVVKYDGPREREYLGSITASRGDGLVQTLSFPQ
jgi:hypothetical protein